MLFVLAGADAPDKTDVVVKKVQEYVKQATEAVKTAFTTVQESEAAQQARCHHVPHSTPYPTDPQRAPGDGTGRGEWS